ncbi:hypothetical protein AMTRI_Chr08g208780 [Amborella trichopoda]
MYIILILQPNLLAKNFKGKSFEYWKELSIIVDNDFFKGAGARTVAQLARDIDDDVEDVRETNVALDDDDDVEEIGDDEDFLETSVQSRKSTSVMPLKKKKKSMVDTVESIGAVVKKISAAIIELMKLAINPHIQEVYRALKQVHGLARPVFMRAYNEMSLHASI